MPFDYGLRLNDRQRIANAREKSIEATKINRSMELKVCFLGAVRRRTFICCRSVRISASSAARGRNRSTTIQTMSLTRYLIPQQHRPILDQLLVRLGLRQGQAAGLRQDPRNNPGVAELQPQDDGPSSRSRPRAAPCGSPTAVCSQYRRRSRRRWSRSRRAACANCTGIPTPMNGSTISKARRAWAYSRRQARRAPSTIRPAMSDSCLSPRAITSKTPARRRCVSWKYSRAAILPTYRSISGWL
jgi:hypothetical protein